MDKPTGKDQPLQCEIEGDEVVIRIGIDVLEHAANNLHYSRGEEMRMQVCDKQEFAKDVVAALNHEEEDGSSPLTELLDEATIAAWEDGSLGLHDAEEE